MNATDSVIIVGSGIAGIVAALELTAAGCPVTLLDRDIAANFGGLALESFGGILLVDTPIQRRHRIHDSPERALADWVRFGELTDTESWPYRWAQAYVNDCRRDVFEWLLARGIRFLPMPHWVERNGNSLPRWHIVWGTGHQLATKLRDRLLQPDRAALLATKFSHRVERLITMGGRVTGVAGVREDNGAAFEYSGRAVLIACGGINGDLDKVRAHWPADRGAPPAHLLNGAHRFADGTVHSAVEAAGGRITHLDNMWNYAAGVRHWLPRKPHHGLSLVPPRGALWLDPTGARYNPPLLAGLDTSEQVARISVGGGVSWLLLNHRIALKELAVSGAEFNPSLRDRKLFAFARDMLFGNRAMLDTLLTRCPDFVVAASLPELVQRMHGIDSDNASDLSLHKIERAVREYDAAICSGDTRDAQIANILDARQWRGDRMRTANLVPILEAGAGPLIAIRGQIISRKSLGGMLTDLHGRVLDGAGRPLAGLFAAGEASGFGGGGMNGRRALEGTFLGGCIYSARRAAQALLNQNH